jgi:hypothetical protein
MMQILRGNCTCPKAQGCLFEEKRPHYIQPAVVGPDAATEVVEAWYKANQSTYFRLIIAYSPSDIERFVTVDHFGVGVDPADVLRRLDIHFSIESLCLSPDPAIVQDLSSTKRCIGLLSRIKNKRGFKLDIMLKQKKIRLNLWTHMFDLFKSVLSEYVEAGAQVRVYWHYTGNPGEIRTEIFYCATYTPDNFCITPSKSHPPSSSPAPSPLHHAPLLYPPRPAPPPPRSPQYPKSSHSLPSHQ